MNVGAAASAAIQAFDRDDAQQALPLGGFPQTQIFGGLLEENRDRPILENDFVGAVLRRCDLARVERGCRDVDRRRLSAQVETHGVRPEQLDQHGREHMLAAVLLHVIEAAGPIDAALDLRSVHGRLGDMDNALAFLDDLQNRRIGNPAKVVRLAAGSRIEGGSIQYRCGARPALRSTMEAEKSLR